MIKSILAVSEGGPDAEQEMNMIPISKMIVIMQSD